MSNLSTISTNIVADSGIDDINVIVSTGSYNNPSWITALSWTKITGTPTFVSSVGLSMPSAFNVTNSPVTGSGTIIVTGAGNATQYVRGDGVLATLPTSGGGGGSSVSYYLNGSVSQGTIGGVAYRELSKVPIFGTGTDISIAADGYIASFITDANDPALLNIPAGNWNFETYFSVSSGGGTPTFYLELYKYDGTTFTLIASSSGVPEIISSGTAIQPYYSTLGVPQTTLAVTDRLAIRYYVTHSGRTITLHTENGHLCEIITTFSTGLTALNGLTDQVQFFQVGTAGNNFNISSISPTHTFNLPSASAINRGALTSADWTTFNNKENAIIAGTTAQYYRGDKTFQTLNTSVVPELTNLYFTQTRVSANTDVAANTAARHAAVTLGTANGLTLSTQQLSLGLASSSQTGALSSTDWNTFNNKANADGSNATGSWNIDITGNSDTANSAQTWTTAIVLTIGGTGRSLNGSTNLSWTLGEIGAQVQLNGTGFVKASGTTITYDNSTYYLASNPDNFTSNLGTVTSVDLSVPTGFVVSNNPITTSGTIALAFQSGYSLPTNAVQSDWTTAYNNSIVSAEVTGTATKTLTLNQQDGGTITASWTDIDTNVVTSVFGRTGAVVAVSGDYTTAQVTESGNLYYTDTRSRAALSFSAGSGAYNTSTGVITIPTNTSQIANGANFITLASLSGTAPIQYNNSTGAISITQASGTTNGFLSSTDWTTFNNKTSNLGTVTSVAALTIGTTGTNITSTVVNGTTTPVITLNVPNASATNRGALTAADWTTFNNKQNAITNPVTGTGAVGRVAYWSSASAITGESNLFWDATNDRLGIGTNTPSARLDVVGGYIIAGTASSPSGSKILWGNYSNGALTTFGSSFSSGGPVIGYGVSPSTSAELAFVSSTGITLSRGAYYIGGGNHYWYAGASQTVAIDSAVTMVNTMSLSASGILTVGNYFATDGTRQVFLNPAADFGIGANPSVQVLSNHALQFATNNGLRAMITAGGNFLIGTSSDNGAKFQVNGTSTFSSNVGIGTTTPNSRLQVSGSLSLPHTTKSANYTLDETDYTVGFDCASNRTATLPDATTCGGRVYVIYQYNTGTGGSRYVTLDGNGSQTINGLTTYSLQYHYDYSSLMIQSNGSNWIIIADALYPAPV